MKHSAILSSSSTKPPIPLSPFLSLNPVPIHFASVKQRRYRISTTLRCSADQPSVSTSSVHDVFGGTREITGLQLLTDKLSPPVRLLGSAAVLAAALAAGYGLGLRIGGNKNAGLGGAVALGAAGGAAVYALNSAVPEVAAVNLHNFVAECDDPLALTKEDIQGIATRYGISKQDETFNAELCDLYCRFVQSVLPPGSEDLKGNEVETIIKFKEALGIDDPEAASMHVEIGRRIFRQRLETGDRDGDTEQRRAFQKLVYISTLVFGEASKFLLPWKRVFGVTDSQIEVAIRDNGQRLYATKLKSINRDLDVEQLVSLRNAQCSYRLSDELAADMFREHMRKLVEENIKTAVDILKSRTTAAGVKVAVDELNKILAFNSKLVSLANHPDSDSLARGVGQVSLVGGEFDNDKRMNELKSLYRAYVVDSVAGGHVEEDKLTALSQLRTIFGLGKRETEAIMLDVSSTAYRKYLSHAVSSGELEAADSKAAYLQNLCDKLRFDPQKASEIHEEIYRQKLQKCVADGELSDEDVSALLRLRVMLCIPQKTVEAAHADICGAIFEKVVKEAIESGVDGYDAEVKASVRKSAHGLRLTREAAMSIASKAVRRMFMNYVRQARSAGSRTESAKILKKMIAFNTLVVSQLVADIKGESMDPVTEEPVKDQKKTEEDEDKWDSLETLRKITPAKELEAKLREPGQTEITLKDDLSEREKADMYKAYLTYCLTGEPIRTPLGLELTPKRDDREYIYLNRLGEILGMTRAETVGVHRALAEQSFKTQAEVLLADGQLTKARMEQLNELQKQVGLPPEYAQRIMKSITTSKMAGAIETAIAQGRLNIKQVRELKEANVDLDSMISEGLRENLYKKTLEEIFSSGTGELDEEEIYQKLPADLNINLDKARRAVQELAKSRLSGALVQAVALLRQRNYSAVVSTLNNLLSCDKAVPSEPLSWDAPEEMADLFAIYLTSEPSSQEKLSRLQYLLGISDSVAATLKDRGARLKGDIASQEEFVF